MFVVTLAQVAVCYLILRWILQRKSGTPYTKHAIGRFLLFGGLALVLTYAASMVISLERDTFFGMNPLLSGFLTALLTAALLEETAKYIMFRLAIRKFHEVVCWLDAIIAAIAVAIGFTLFEDLVFTFSGDVNILRAILPGHILFQAVMGYYYGKARVTHEVRYHVLSLVVPILLHTLFDMFLIALMSIVGDPAAATSMTEAEIMSLPYAGYMVPLLVCAIAVMIATVIGLVVLLRTVSKWSARGEKQERLA